MLYTLLLIGIINANECSDVEFKKCQFISSHCEYTYDFLNDDNKQVLTKLDYKLLTNSTMYSINTFVYESVLEILIYTDKYPSCESFNFLQNETLDCMICPNLITGLILNPNYKNIIEQTNFNLIICMSVLLIAIILSIIGYIFFKHKKICKT